MKKLLFLIAIIVIVIIIIAYYNGGSKESPVDNPKNKALLNLVKKEPKVKDAIISDALFLYASVVDDNTNRNGYAEYICQLVKEQSSTVEKVKIVDNMDVVNKKKQDDWRVLGECWCK